jgi:malonyl-CoA decarboxylase
MTWLNKNLDENSSKLFSLNEANVFKGLSQFGDTPEQTLKLLLKNHSWQKNKVISEALRLPLMRLCAHYLIIEKGTKNKALDPVAHFHLTNGAQMEKLNWQGDLSPRGMKNSAGIMINYLYDLSSVENIHEAYNSVGEVAASQSVRSLL